MITGAITQNYFKAPDLFQWNLSNIVLYLAKFLKCYMTYIQTL